MPWDTSVTQYGPCSRRTSSLCGGNEHWGNDRVKRVVDSECLQGVRRQKSRRTPLVGGQGSMSMGWQVSNVKGSFFKGKIIILLKYFMNTCPRFYFSY